MVALVHFFKTVNINVILEKICNQMFQQLLSFEDENDIRDVGRNLKTVPYLFVFGQKI